MPSVLREGPGGVLKVRPPSALRMSWPGTAVRGEAPRGRASRWRMAATPNSIPGTLSAALPPSWLDAPDDDGRTSASLIVRRGAVVNLTMIGVLAAGMTELLVRTACHAARPLPFARILRWPRLRRSTARSDNLGTTMTCGSGIYSGRPRLGTGAPADADSHIAADIAISGRAALTPSGRRMTGPMGNSAANVTGEAR